MATQRLSIKEIRRPHPISIVSPSDFEAEQGGLIESAQVLQDPRFSLYCFDPDRASALFVETDDPDAVDRAPFYYQAQSEHAVGLVSMPMEEFHRVAENIPALADRLLWVHSVGRCGSTLISKVLAAVPSVHSLSEPDDLTQLVHLKVAGTLSDEWIQGVLESSVKWRCKPRAGASAEFVAIKPRSEVMVLAEMMASSFPAAKHFFLYRNAISWMTTLFRGFPPERDVYDVKRNREMQRSWASTIPLVGELARDNPPLNAIQVRILAWVACMEAYFGLASSNVPTCAARFEDLTAEPRATLEQIFRFFEIDFPDWRAIEEVLSRDSQAGTIYDREERRKQPQRELTDALVQDILDLLASRPLLKEPEPLVPNAVRAGR